MLWQAANLPALVDYNNKKVGEVHVTELTQQLTTAVESDPPLPVEEVLSATQARKQEWNLSDVDIIKVCSLQVNIQVFSICLKISAQCWRFWLPCLGLSPVQACSMAQLCWLKPAFSMQLHCVIYAWMRLRVLHALLCLHRCCGRCLWMLYQQVARMGSRLCLPLASRSRRTASF